MIGGLIFNVAGGDASECSLLLIGFVCADFVGGLDTWVDGGGVMAPVSRTGEPSRSLDLLPSLVMEGFWGGDVLSWRIAWPGLGVRGVLSSDILGNEVYLWLGLRYLQSALLSVLRTIHCCGYVPKLEQTPPGQAEVHSEWWGCPICGPEAMESLRLGMEAGGCARNMGQMLEGNERRAPCTLRYFAGGGWEGK